MASEPMSRRSALIRGLLASIVLCGGSACMKTIEYAKLQHPFRGAQLYADTDTLAHAWQTTHAAPWLAPITATPQARWLTGPEDLTGLVPVVGEAGRQGRLLVLVAYDIPNRDCAGQGAADAKAYAAWIERLRDTLGAARTVVILEPDSIADDCFDDARAAALASAVRTLTGAGHYVYLDAGHPRWRPAAEMAKRLHAAGIADAEGFSVNVSNRQSTADSQRYAAELSELTGGREAGPRGHASPGGRRPLVTRGPMHHLAYNWRVRHA
jgi:endoglucanase